MLAIVLAMILPTPADLLRAETLLTQPEGVPADAWPEGRVALLAVMQRRGALDAGGGGMWFGANMPWDAEIDHARRVVWAARGCPEVWEGDWLPDADLCRRVAAFNRAQAERLRERAAWEPERATLFEEAVCECDGLAHLWDLLGDVAGPSSWQRPRRVQLGEARAALGVLWDRREWPDQTAWWTLTPR